MKSGSTTNQQLTNGKAVFIHTNHQLSQLSIRWTGSLRNLNLKKSKRNNRLESQNEPINERESNVIQGADQR